MQENLAAYFNGNDFAVPVVFGSQTINGILNAPGTVLASGEVLSTDYQLIYPTGALSPELKYEDAITVDGVNFTVNTVLPEPGDGKLTGARLSKV